MVVNLAKLTKVITLALAFLMSIVQDTGQITQPLAQATEVVPQVVTLPTTTPVLPNIQVHQVQIDAPVNKVQASLDYPATAAEVELNQPENQPVQIKDLMPLYGEDYACTVIWRASPPEGEAPYWLSTPDSPEGLYTDFPYVFLAGALITNGVVDASQCPNNGLLPNGAADTCGLEIARAAVTEWQNQFNVPIYEYADAHALPAVLLKRVFALESQFWFGISTDGYHAGLGHTTPIGLDPLFLFYPGYFSTICPLLFSDETCEGTYSDLSMEERAMMRGFLYDTRLDATCPDCPYGVDIEKATASIDIFAKLINSNCHQTNTLFLNLTNNYAGNAAPYEDLWKFTMGNYNVGSGCMSSAYYRTFTREDEFTWDNVSRNLQDNCAFAIIYVDGISY
jgi:hypothetical protein